MSIDLKKQTTIGLRNLLANSERLRNSEMALAVVVEMHERGMATSREYALFPWNQDRVDEVMAPFMRIAAGVSGNQRVNYTRAGGSKIGLKKDDPKHSWVDSYSAIKVSGVNAVFGCAIARPGQDPTFTLYLGGGSRREAAPSQTYNADELQRALSEWESIARSSSADDSA
jgi:hypothetical protein